MQLLTTVLVLASLHAAAAAELWPQPHHQMPSRRVLYLQPDKFDFHVTGRGSDLLKDALDRYSTSLRGTPVYALDAEVMLQRLDMLAGRVHNLSVYVKYSDQSLNLGTDEAYELHVDTPEAKLVADTVLGALRGLETFSQLVDRVDLPPDLLLGDAAAAALADTAGGAPSWQGGCAAALLSLFSSAADALLQRHKKHGKHGHGNHRRGKHHTHRHGHKKKHHHHGGGGARSLWIINATVVKDAPRFLHRGLLIDTARHYLPISVIKAHLDAMSWVKLNVLHWHLVDDQSFPYVSAKLPGLSREGAFAPGAVYTPEDVREVVAYARARGIRVIPELDTPGHTLSWGRSDPQLLAQCYDEHGPTGTPGPLDPTRKHTYTVVWKLLRELAARFPDSYLHLGGDEVPLGCWQHNPRIQDWMRAQNISDVRALEQHYVRRLLQLAAAANRSYIVWQEVLDNGAVVANDTLVHVWKWWWPTDVGDGGGCRASGDSRAAAAGRRQCNLSTGCRWVGGTHLVHEKPQGFIPELERVTKQGFRTLLSSPWYLNLGAYSEENWLRYHAVEPLAFEGSDAQKALVVGGEAAMWGEFTDAANALSKTWPDAAAVAERLWSPPAAGHPQQEEAAARRRLAEHRCRMLARGGVASPIGPGFCPADVSASVSLEQQGLQPESVASA